MVQCVSCGHQSTKDAYCEDCGAALPQATASDDDVLSLMLGLVCDKCDSYNDPGSASCLVCAAPLGDAPADAPSPAPPQAAAGWMAAPEGEPLPTANAMPAVDLSVLAHEGQAGLAAPAAPAAPSAAPAGAAISCAKCASPVRDDDRFCPRCGHRVGELPQVAPSPAAAAQAKAAATMMMAAVPGATFGLPAAPAAVDPKAPAPAPSATMFFGAAQVSRFARLILVKGHTQFGSQWRLQAGQTLIGRNQGVVIFPDDVHLADRHCRLEFRGDDLWLVPEPTTNGVFLQVKGKVGLSVGTEFVCGHNRFRLAGEDERRRVLPEGDGDTVAWGSPYVPQNLVLERLAADPRFSETYVRPQRLLSIGRAGCDLNFGDDPYLSTRHAQLEREGDAYFLEDTGSRNGTFVRLRGERKLQHGDGIMLGEQVMRVEVATGVGS